MKPVIPQSALPTQMDPENRVTATYSTQVLFPRLGPLATQRIVRRYARVLRDYAAAVELVQGARDFATRYGVPFQIPAPPPVSTNDDPRFEPVLGARDAYLSGYLVALAEFSDARPTAAKVYATAAMAVAGPGTVAAADFVRSVVTGSQNGLTYAPDAVLPDALAEMLTHDPSADLDTAQRLVLQPLEPTLLIGAGRAVREFILDAGPGARLPPAVVRESLEASLRGAAAAQLMHGLAQPNVVIAEMVRLGLVGASGTWLSERLASTRDPLALIAVELAAERKRRATGEGEPLAMLMGNSEALLLHLGMPAGEVMTRLRADAEVRAHVYDFLGGWVDEVGLDIDGGIVPLPDSLVVTGHREWAFNRTERLNLKVGTPTLRGPFQADAVSPNSELTISESSLTESVRFTETGSGRDRRRSSEAVTFSASTFRESLSTLSEDGINDDTAFSQNSTLFDTLRERRREAIERTLVEISSSNEQRSGSASTTVTSTARSYTTRGKDPRFATTELAFQVVAPVAAEVLLERVGIVWCPRMDSPFMYLHALIVRHEREAELEYLEQNSELDPVRPVAVYEQSSFTHEVGITGDTTFEAKPFLFVVPAGLTGWELDRAATTVGFRNGTSADYNWDEQWNWDDLENWNAWIESINHIDRIVTGVAVLETTDPEWLNRGFLTFKIVMRRLTAEARAALENYERDKQEAAAQRRSVAVRARQYARLRRDELIEQYEDTIALQEEAFSGLAAQVFQGSAREHVSYYRGILHSCIEWSNARIQLEPGRVNTLPFPHLAPSHFMNAVGVRFTLPVLPTAEDAFFDALEEGAGSYHRDAADGVRKAVSDYRDLVELLKRDDPSGLVLDSYSSQLVLGRHLEAVLSQHPFAEPSP
jgi:hypothetical protein